MTIEINFEKRLQALEEKFEYQDITIDTLNEVIIAQQQELDGLKQDLIDLKESASLSGQAGDNKSDPPPPHY